LADLNAALARYTTPEEFNPDKLSLVVKPNSTGGSLVTAIEIGRVLRRFNAIALQLEEEKCFSACVFIIAGAPRRIVHGQVGIHRPYLEKDNQTTVSGQKKQKSKIDNLALSYLKEMNISQSLYHDMVRISPQNIKILSNDDLLKYGLGSSDPLVEDAENAKKAKELGISTSDLLKRKNALKANCKRTENVTTESLNKCYEEIMHKGNLDYLPETTGNTSRTVSEDKDTLIATLDKLRPNWRELVKLDSFKVWKSRLSREEQAVIDTSWDPYLVNNLLQKFVDQNNANPNKSKTMRLVCVADNVDMLFIVDFEKSTVDGVPAKITDDFITYRTDRLDISINRALGSIFVKFVPPYSKNGIPLTPARGPCKQAEENRF